MRPRRGLFCSPEFIWGNGEKANVVTAKATELLDLFIKKNLKVKLGFWGFLLGSLLGSRWKNQSCRANKNKSHERYYICDNIWKCEEKKLCTKTCSILSLFTSYEDINVLYICQTYQAWNMAFKQDNGRGSLSSFKWLPTWLKCSHYWCEYMSCR